MEVFVTGATGYVGSAVVDGLVDAGHRVLGLVRSDWAEATLSSRHGVEPVRGDLGDRAALVEAAERADATIHVASGGRGAEAVQAEACAVGAFLAALQGSGKALVYTSGTVVYGDTGTSVAHEDAPLRPPPERAWRLPFEQRILAAHHRGIRPVVIRPSFIYGRAGGVTASLIEAAQRQGVARYIGAGQNRFSTVHVDDLAQIYVLALETQGSSGPYNAASGEVEQRQLAQAVANLTAASVTSWPLTQARSHLGIYADTMVMTIRSTATKARRELGWKPRRPAVADEIQHGSYRNLVEDHAQVTPGATHP
jgi:nucleoside-diphosphate-sugar epimerase